MPNLDDRLDQFEKDFAEHPYRTGFWVTLKWGALITILVLVFVGIAGLISTGSVFFQGAKAKLTIKPRVEQRVFTPENAIAQIAFFHDQCEGVNAQAQIVGNNERTYLSDLQAAHFARDPIRQQQAQEALSQDSQDVAGARNVLVTRAADYNSRSQQSTANVFKGHGLPRRIDVPTSDQALATFHVDCGAGR